MRIRVLFLWLFCAASSASGSPLTNWPSYDGSLWINDAGLGATGVTGPIGNTSIDPNPGWNIAQFGNPSPLNSGAVSLSGSNWQIQSGDYRVNYYSGSSSYTQLAQGFTGANSHSCGQEMDLLLQPVVHNQIDESVSPNAAVSTLSPARNYVTASNSLSNLNHIYAQATVTLVYTAVPPAVAYCSGTADDSKNFSGYMIGIVLNNNSNHSVIKYQLLLGNTYFMKTPQISTSDILVGNSQSPVDYVFQAPVNCLKTVVGQTRSCGSSPTVLTQQSLNTPTTYSVDVLADIEDLLTNPGSTLQNTNPSGPNYIDPNCSNWVVTGGYFGQNLYGSAAATSNWSGMTIATD